MKKSLLNKKEIAKIKNTAKSTPGNSKKNSPLYNRSDRNCVNVFSKEQEKILTSLISDGKSDNEKRKEQLREWGMDDSKILSANMAGAGRCGIAMDEASFSEEIEKVTEKFVNQFTMINEGTYVCPICGQKILVGEKVEFSHWLSKSETEFRQNAENVDYTHEKCNRIYGDNRSEQDVEKWFETIQNMLDNKEKVMEFIKKSQDASKNYSFDEMNRPYFKSI